MLHIIRFVGILLMLPILNLSGYKINVKTCIFLAFAGLRGAVGLSLAIIVSIDDKID